MAVSVIMVTTVVMAVVVPMIMAGTAIMLVIEVMMAMMVMLLGIDQGGGQRALDGDRCIARSLGVLDGQSHNFGGEAHVVDLTEIVAPQSPLPVEQQDRRRTLHFVGGHRLRQAGSVGLVDADREWPAILVNEGFQRLSGHRVVMLEYGVQAQDLHLVVGEALYDPFCKRQAVLHAAGAKHLEGLQHDDLALEACERQRRLGVDPS